MLFLFFDLKNRLEAVEFLLVVVHLLAPIPCSRIQDYRQPDFTVAAQLWNFATFPLIQDNILPRSDPRCLTDVSMRFTPYLALTIEYTTPQVLTVNIVCVLEFTATSVRNYESLVSPPEVNKSFITQ